MRKSNTNNPRIREYINSGSQLESWQCPETFLTVLATGILWVEARDAAPLLRVPWTARKSNQSVLKEINLNYSLEGLLLKLKPQYFDHLKQKADSLEKTLMLGKIEGRSRRGTQRMRWLDGITKSMDMSLSRVRRWWTGKPSML